MRVLHFSQHPKALWILSLTELCERFAFWGVGSLLVLYLIEYYQVADAKADKIYGLFTGISTFLPLIGGRIADKWNYQGPILLGALLNVVGCFLLSIGHLSLLYTALTLLALGFGLFTPSIVTVLGYTYKDLPALREGGFTIYYASINIGVFLALASLGTIAKLKSWNVAFFTAGIVQIIGLAPLIWYLIQHKETYQDLKQLQKASHIHKQRLSLPEKDRLWVCAIFGIASILFWTAYNQGFSSMAIFIHRYMDKIVFGIDIPEGVFLSIESLFLVILAPLLSFLYLWLQEKRKDPSPALKTAFSFFFMTLCFAVMILAAATISQTMKSANISPTYLIISYLFMAFAEMFFAPIGLSLFSRLSPTRFTALIIGFWYACSGLASYLSGFFAAFMGEVGSMSAFFALFSLSMLLPGLILYFFARKLTLKSHFH